MKQTKIGGQAVIEGVMMRGKKMYAMAVWKTDGTLEVEKTPLNGGLYTFGLFRVPIFRGMAAFLQSMVLGVKIIMRSAQLAGLEDEVEEEPGRLERFFQEKFGEKLADYLIYLSVAISLVFSIGLFFVLPVVIGNFFRPFLPGTWALGIVEGLLRLAIFLGYIYLISRMEEMQKVFRFHGAEHKTINCFEHEEELTVENVQKHTRLHKRCGTSFLIYVMLISMVVFFFVRVDTIWLRLVSRILLVPFVAGISYEVIMWAGRSENKLVQLISKPGFALQMFTTAEPGPREIEAAIAAMKGVLEDEPE